MKIYISGKMRGLPEEESRIKFEAARQYLIELGHDVVNPWDSEKEKEAQCLEWEDYILYDLKIIKGCDALFMLDNWQDSDGAKCEHAFASGMGIEILYEKRGPVNEELDQAAKRILNGYACMGTFQDGKMYTEECMLSICKAGANWQREQIAQHNMLLPFREYDNLLESVNRRKKEGYEAGFKQGTIDAKEELLKEAVDAEVSMRIMPNSKAYVSFDTFHTDLCYNEGDKIKLIIIQKD